LVRKEVRTVAHIKTAVSIEESLFREAEEWAGKLGISRSRLFAEAVREYVRRRENEELLERLNEAHAGGPDEEDEKALRHMQALHLQMLEREVKEER
jgi:predicted transcriptional regulator